MLANAIDELRAICMNKTIENFWKKCGELSETWTGSQKPETDQDTNVAITQVDSIINDNDPRHHAPLNLALMMIRANLEGYLETNTHTRQSTAFYLKHIDNFLQVKTNTYTTPLYKQKAVLANLNLLLEHIRDLLFLDLGHSIETVEKTIFWCQDGSDELTPFHMQLCILSLKAGSWTKILPHLRLDFNIINPALSNGASYVSFFYYGAIIFGANEMWEEMEVYLEQSLNLPAHVMSQLHIDAYKKYLLVCLALGKKPGLPSYVQKSRVQRVFTTDRAPRSMLRHMSTERLHLPSPFDLERADRGRRIWPYDMFVRECENGREREEIERMRPVLESDNNLSLAKCAVQRLIERRVINMRQYYTTAPISWVRKRANLDSNEETRNVLEHMIAENRIHAHCDGDMVHFDDDPNWSEKIINEIKENDKITSSLTRKLIKADRDVQKDPLYMHLILAAQEKEERTKFQPGRSTH